jgi:hypothetical protein
MLTAEQFPSYRLGLSRIELDALKRASETGWLTITSAIGQQALTRWQRECDRRGKAFAMVRVEPRRATLWFILATNHEWTEAEQVDVRAAVATATGCVVTANSACAFAKLGTEAALMERLLALAAEPRQKMSLQH